MFKSWDRRWMSHIVRSIFFFPCSKKKVKASALLVRLKASWRTGKKGSFWRNVQLVCDLKCSKGFTCPSTGRIIHEANVKCETPCKTTFTLRISPSTDTQWCIIGSSSLCFLLPLCDQSWSDGLIMERPINAVLTGGRTQLINSSV